MNLIKVHNLVQSNHECDYKGLDLTKIVGGTQLYPNNENAAYLMYNAEIPSHAELEIITQLVYDSVQEYIRLSKPPSIEERLDDAEAALNVLLGL
ncbi:hypothetical protein ACFFHH_03400 [Cytobacillus solani]|uniref:hypothetical protein n=1 Tax=Cytobacillus solani TaxID=1637975 RepID=UPI0006ABB0C2|nr:hypothetical protein [Cytobacillus solani]KOP70974.1 hypothetical protein AMS60_23240 [Bacillus sp. FJAT-21945]USK55910.1 hypothetical protein LIS82_05105 [Cytobacillus solani]